MSRALQKRIEKLEGVLIDPPLVNVRLVAEDEALVAHHGSVDQAAAALLEEDRAKSVDFLLLSLNSASADEFMGRNPGWDAYKRQGRS